MLSKLKVNKLTVADRLLVAKNAVLLVENNDASTSEIDLTELGVLDGLTATTAEINAVCDGNTATAAEITRAADISGRVITTAATSLNLTVTEHAERIILINTDDAGNSSFNLPEAIGSGAKMTLINNVVQTQGTIVFAANGTDTLTGICLSADSSAATSVTPFLATATSDKATLNLTTTGGLGQDMFEAWDVAANVWKVRMVTNGSGVLATPFAAT